MRMLSSGEGCCQEGLKPFSVLCHFDTQQLAQKVQLMQQNLMTTANGLHCSDVSSEPVTYAQTHERSSICRRGLSKTPVLQLNTAYAT